MGTQPGSSYLLNLHNDGTLSQVQEYLRSKGRGYQQIDMRSEYLQDAVLMEKFVHEIQATFDYEKPIDLSVRCSGVRLNASSREVGLFNEFLYDLLVDRQMRGIQLPDQVNILVMALVENEYRDLKDALQIQPQVIYVDILGRQRKGYTIAEILKLAMPVERYLHIDAKSSLGFCPLAQVEPPRSRKGLIQSGLSNLREWVLG